MKIKHILESKEFASIFKSGEKVCGKTLSLHYKQAEKFPDLYIGVTVSKKFARKAVRRNYIKRIIYSYFRDPENRCKRSLAIVVRVIKNTGKLRKKPLSLEIREELTYLTKKAGVQQ